VSYGLVEILALAVGETSPQDIVRELLFKLTVGEHTLARAELEDDELKVILPALINQFIQQLTGTGIVSPVGVFGPTLVGLRLLPLESELLLPDVAFARRLLRDTIDESNVVTRVKLPD
jgi:hypothetical protein